MNERPVSSGAKRGVNVHLWVIPARRERRERGWTRYRSRSVTGTA